MLNKHSVHELEANWKDYSSHYPKSLLEIGRAKVLIGPDGVVKNTEISMAVMEIDPGCIYPVHNHDAPEVYYVLEGEANWEFRGQNIIFSNIRVNCDLTLFTQAGRVDRLKSGVPMQRGGQPDEVAEAILWLLSDASAYTSGSFIDVSGGR